MTVCYNNYFFFSDITSILKETPDKDELLNLLFDISDKWYDIGLSLQVCRNVLDNLKETRNDKIYNLIAVIDNFLISQPSSVNWVTVITAIEGPIINNQKIADEIRQRLKFSKLLLLSNEVVLLILSLLIKCIVQIFLITAFYSVVKDFDIVSLHHNLHVVCSTGI